MRLEGDRLCSPPRGPGPAFGAATGQKGVRVRGSLRARGPAGLSSSDRMSFLSLVPLEWRWVEMCMSEEYAPSSQAHVRLKEILCLQR